MMKRLFAALTALACAVPAVPAVTASALSWEGMTEYLVMDTYRNAENELTSLTLLEIGTPHTYTLSNCGTDLAAALEGQDAPEIGDILSVSVPEMLVDVIPGCLHYPKDAPPEIDNLGHITEIAKPEYLTLTKADGWKYTLRDEDLNSRYYYASEEYGGMPVPDLELKEEGLFYVYNNHVLLQTSPEEISPEQIPWNVSAILVGEGLADVEGIGLCRFTATEDSFDNELGIGDAVKLKMRGLAAKVYPAQLPTIERIDYLGSGADRFGYGEYTVTANDGNYLTLTNRKGEESKYCYKHPDLELKFYNAGMAENAQVGDTLAFMHNANGAPVVPFDAEKEIRRHEFVVIGVDDPDAPQNYIIIGSGSPTAVYALGADDLERYLADGGTPLSYGDIFTFAGDYASTCIWGTNDILLSKPETIRIEGSVFDTAETAVFTLDSASAETFVWLEGAEKGYEYPVDFMRGTGLSFGDAAFFQPGGIDWTKPDMGDRLTMYTYRGVPMFPKSMERIGDVSGDGDVNAADAADLLVTAAENGAGMARAVSFAADVNTDSTVDALDAAAVLTYAAARGSGARLTWEEVLGTKTT